MSFIKYGKSDYLIVENENKLVLGSVIAKGQLLLEKGIEKDETTVQIKFKKKDVRANLGDSPLIGKSVYGISITPFMHSSVHPNFGQVNFYVPVEERDEKLLFKAFDRTWKTLKKNKCIAAFPLNSIGIHKGKASVASQGHKYSQKANKAKEITRFADFYILDYKDKEWLDHNIYSMCAKAIWMTQVPEDVQHKWVKLYHKYLVLRTLEEKQLKTILDSINDYCQETEGANITAYMKDVCDDEDKIIVQAIRRHINSVHKINGAKLDKFIIRDPKFVADIWPTHIDFSLPKSSVSLAAEKSVEEMFSECLAFYFRGAELNKTFKKYVKNTLKSLTGKFES